MSVEKKTKFSFSKAGQESAQALHDTDSGSRPLSEDAHDQDKISNEVRVMIAFGVMVFLMMCNFHLCLGLGDLVYIVTHGLFGCIAYVLPVILFLAYLFMLPNQGDAFAASKIFHLIVFMMEICCYIHLFTVKQTDEFSLGEYFTAGQSGINGGLIGGILAGSIQHLIGTIAAMVLLVLITLITLVLLTETSAERAVEWYTFGLRHRFELFLDKIKSLLPKKSIKTEKSSEKEEKPVKTDKPVNDFRGQSPQGTKTIWEEIDDKPGWIEEKRRRDLISHLGANDKKEETVPDQTKSSGGGEYVLFGNWDQEDKPSFLKNQEKEKKREERSGRFSNLDFPFSRKTEKAEEETNPGEEASKPQTGFDTKEESSFPPYRHTYTDNKKRGFAFGKNEKEQSQSPLKEKKHALKVPFSKKNQLPEEEKKESERVIRTEQKEKVILLNCYASLEEMGFTDLSRDASSSLAPVEGSRIEDFILFDGSKLKPIANEIVMDKSIPKVPYAEQKQAENDWERNYQEDSDQNPYDNSYDTFYDKPDEDLQEETDENLYEGSEQSSYDKSGQYLEETHGKDEGEDLYEDYYQGYDPYEEDKDPDEDAYDRTLESSYRQGETYEDELEGDGSYDPTEHVVLPEEGAENLEDSDDPWMMPQRKPVTKPVHKEIGRENQTDKNQTRSPFTGSIWADPDKPRDSSGAVSFSSNRPASVTAQKEEIKPYVAPPVECLDKGKGFSNEVTEQHLEVQSKLKITLSSFGVNVTMGEISPGPAVTRYELLPEAGVKVARIVALQDDLKLALAAADIRIEAPIPGKSAIGIEVPNEKSTLVGFRDLIESERFRNSKSNIAVAVGRDLAGKVVVTDLAKMPHLLIAGATGSGKSVCINTIIMSLIYKSSPEQVKLIMIDPKVVELSVYNGIPHLLVPVVTDARKASNALKWAVEEMDDRYNKFAQYNVRNLEGYNEHIKKERELDPEFEEELMYQMVIIVDELADLMMVAPGDVEEAICRLAQKARAAGIHLVLATQRPSVNVITGLIKANVPSRIAFAVSSGVDSRTIIDMNGAEKLLGKGDMLFYPYGLPKPVRVQGAFISDDEVTRVVDFVIRNNNGPTGQDRMQQMIQNASENSASHEERDELFRDAGVFVIEKDKGSIGALQRNFRIGFNRAARIMDQLADVGVVGPEEGTKPRRIQMTLEEFNGLF